MSRREKLNLEQYRGLLLMATPPGDRWKNGIEGANSPRTYDSLVRRGLLRSVDSSEPEWADRDDRLVPTVAGWRALRAYEQTHARCGDCGCRRIVVERPGRADEANSE